MRALQQPVKLFIGPVIFRDYIPDFLAVMSGKYQPEFKPCPAGKNFRVIAKRDRRAGICGKKIQRLPD
jgi:hypothetical protein